MPLAGNPGSCAKIDRVDDPAGYVCWRHRISLDEKISVLTCVLEPAALLLIICRGPIQLAAGGRYGKRGIQKYQEIGMGNALPHVRYIGMLLGDMPDGVALRL